MREPKGVPRNSVDSVTVYLRDQFKALNRTWQFSGDVNDIEFGGVRFRKSKSGEGIEYIYYIGNDNLVEGMENKYTGVVYLNDMIELLPDVWAFADMENCGADIGGLMTSLEAWNGFLTRN